MGKFKTMLSNLGSIMKSLFTPTTQNVSFAISAKPGPMTLTVETVPFTIYTDGAAWTAQEDVQLNGPNVGVEIGLRGSVGQAYDMTMTINGVDQEIKGKLTIEGINEITNSYPLSTFKL